MIRLRVERFFKAYGEPIKADVNGLLWYEDGEAVGRVIIAGFRWRL